MLIKLLVERRGVALIGGRLQPQLRAGVALRLEEDILQPVVESPVPRRLILQIGRQVLGLPPKARRRSGTVVQRAPLRGGTLRGGTPLIRG